MSIVFAEMIPAALAADSRIEVLRNEVAPRDGVSIPVEWGNLLPELKALGAVNTTLLNKGLIESRGHGLTDSEAARFDGESHEIIRIDNASKTYLMYIFWAVAFVNAKPILNSSAHMYGNKTSPVGPAKYGSLVLFKFSPAQQMLIEDVALNSYRPCCNAPTLKPDCSHGFAALGLLEFLVSKGFSREQLFKTLLQFNSYSFTNEYVDVALMLQEQGQSWSDANATQLVGYSYSSIEARQAIRKYLVERGIYDPETRTYSSSDLLTKYREPILILAATVVTAATVALVGVIWMRRSPDEPATSPPASEPAAADSRGGS